jgi:hypothetical protein
MSRKIFTLFISLLVAAALAVLAQSPTTSAPTGSSSTQDPYGATLDHPNPTGNNSTAPITDSHTALQGNTTTTTVAPTSPGTPATGTDNSAATTTSATPSTDNMSNNSSTTTTTTAPSTTTTSTTPDTSTSTDTTTPTTLPRTGSELPLLAALGLLALCGAVTARTFAKRSA